MKNIICIDTGGTFNKIYDTKKGILDVDKDSNAIKHIFKKWLGKFELISIIGKDSLEFTENDRELLLETIKSTPITSSIIVIHGTDTMDISAAYVSDANLPQTIIFTGAMTPFSIELHRSNCKSYKCNWFWGITARAWGLYRYKWTIWQIHRYQKRQRARLFYANKIIICYNLCFKNF